MWHRLRYGHWPKWRHGRFFGNRNNWAVSKICEVCGVEVIHSSGGDCY